MWTISLNPNWDHLHFIQVVLRKDPVVVCFETKLLFGSVQAQKDTESPLSILHQVQLSLDFCSTGKKTLESWRKVKGQVNYCWDSLRKEFRIHFTRNISSLLYSSLEWEGGSMGLPDIWSLFLYDHCCENKTTVIGNGFLALDSKLHVIPWAQIIHLL